MMSRHVVAVFPSHEGAKEAAAALAHHGFRNFEVDATADREWAARRIGHRAEAATGRLGPVAGPEAAATNRAAWAGLGGFAIGCLLAWADGGRGAVILAVGLAASSAFWLGGLVWVSHQLSQRALLAVHQYQASSLGVDVAGWLDDMRVRLLVGRYGPRVVRSHTTESERGPRQIGTQHG